mmetsp:Transcript_31248/g.77922  ORF Transcript_31248/g.77922 Transcript_31248/m.77922 type:complete len:83 (-) Transcript_31248:1152-1400(-)
MISCVRQILLLIRMLSMPSWSLLITPHSIHLCDITTANCYARRKATWFIMRRLEKVLLDAPQACLSVALSPAPSSSWRPRAA